VECGDWSREDSQAIARILECRIYEKTHGRISGVCVEVFEDRLVVHGCAKTYHVKQLALEAIAEVTHLLVDLHIDVDAAKAQTERRCGRRMPGES
jgi:hypothetical protein